MVQSSMDMGGDELEIRAKVVLSLEQAKRQLQELGGNLSGGAANLAGQAGAAMGIGTRGANADAEPTRTKEQDERAKVRTTALQTLAKSAPGGGLATSMAKSFGQGGMVSGIATGITAVVGILTSIMKSSQVFQTLAGTIFKILGMMADLFLMPFVPLMMKFASWMIQHMPDVIRWGETTAKWVERIFNFFSGKWGSGLTEQGKEEGGVSGFFKRAVGMATSKEGLALIGGSIMVASGVGAPAGVALAAYGAQGIGKGLAEGKYQMGGKVPGGAGEEVQATLHGGEIVVPQDIAAGGKEFSGKVAAWIQRFQQKEMGPGGVMERWYDQMFGNSILPDVWGNIHGFFGGIETEARGINTRVAGDTEELEADRKGFWDKLKFWEYLPEIWGKVSGFFSDLGTTLKDFFTFDIPGIDLSDAAATVGACFGRAKNAVGNFFSNTLPNAAGAAASGIATAASTTWNVTTSVVSSTVSALTTAGSAVKNFFTDTIPNWAGNAKDAVVDAAKYTWGIAETVGSAVKTGLVAAGSAVGGFFSDTLPGWAGTAKDKVVELAGNVYNSAKNIGSWTYRGLSNAGSAIGGFFTGTLPGWAGTAKDKVVEIAGGVYNSAQYIGSWTYRGLSNAGSSVGSFFTSTLPGWANTAKDTVVRLAGGVSGVASWVITGISQAMNSAKNAVQSFLSGLGEKVANVAGDAWAKTGGRVDWTPWNNYGNSSSNYYDDLYAFGNSVTSSGMRHFGGSSGAGGGPRFAMGVPQGNGGGVTSNRVVNVNITSSLSVHDIVRDVERLESIQEAAFFNTV